MKTATPCHGLLLGMALFSAAAANAQLLEEITVTATRRAADIQEVPISISAYSGDFIADSGIDTLQDLSLYAPNFSFATSSQPTNARLIIRGIGSVGNNAIEPAVGVFIDGVYYPRPGALLGNLLDMQSVEVLRGPQGTLFGRNTAAGALNLRSNDPGDAAEGHLLIGAGNYSAVSVEGVASAALGDRVSGRIALRYADRDGFGYNSLTSEEIGERDDLTLRGKLLFDISAGTSAKLVADYNEINSGGSIVEIVTASANPVFEGTLNALFGAGALSADGYDFVVNQDHQDSLVDEQWGISADITHEIGTHTLRSITAVREWEASTRESALRIPADVLPRNTLYDTRTVSQEFQLLSAEGESIEYIAGLFFYDEQYDIDQDFDAGAQACIPVVFALAGAPAAGACAAAAQNPAVASTYRQSLSSYAAFAQSTFNVNERVSLTIGGRYTTESKDASFEQLLLNPIIGGLFRAAESEPALSADDDAFTWLVNASIYPSDAVMLFATASTGFKGGGFNSEGAANALGSSARTFDAETSRNFEAGLKSELLDGRMTANITLYLTELEDFQDRSFDGLSFITRNAGSRTQSGLETDIYFRPVDSLLLIAGASYLDAEFDEFVAASPLPGSTVPQDLSGQRPNFSPEWQASLVADWNRPLSDTTLDWGIRAEWQYTGEQLVGSNTNLNPQATQDAYSLFNIRLGIGNERWRLSLFARNLTDEAYCQVYFDQPLGDSLGAVDPAANTTVQRCVLGMPATYGASLRVEF